MIDINHRIKELDSQRSDISNHQLTEDLLRRAIEHKKSPVHVGNFLRHKYSIRYNELLNRTEIDGSDSHTIKRDEYLFYATENADLNLEKGFASDLTNRIGYDNSYNPIAEYLNSIPLDTDTLSDSEIADMFGIKEDDKTSLLALYIGLRCAYQRGLTPGCEAQTITIFYGQQGFRKSTSVKALVPDTEWYASLQNDVDINSKDFLATMNGHFINEIAEIEQLLTNKNASIIKGWLSKTSDSYVEKYERHSSEHLRRGVIFGTTNVVSLLSDITGNRRFYITEISKPMKPELIAQNRDRLWATIRHQLANGEKSYIIEGSDKAQMFAERADSYSVCDPVSTIIEDYVIGLQVEKIHLKTVFEDLSNQGVRIENKQMKFNVGSIFKRHGFAFKKQFKIDGSNRSGYVKETSPANVFKRNKFESIQF